MVSEVKNNIIKLTVLYFAAHWLLLLVTGYWIDDWCVYDQPIDEIVNMFTETGTPFAVLSYIFNSYLPEDGYKKIIFLLNYINVLFLYKILRNWLKCEHNICFWICALYAVIPCFDARITLIMFNGTLNMFSFMLGLCILSEMLFVRKITAFGRIVMLFLFLYSFNIASFLIFYSLLLLMIYTKEKSLKSAWKYIDFILLPIAYWIFKNVFFPAHGAYAGYNAISLWGLVKATLLLLPADGIMLLNLLKNYVMFAAVPLVIGAFLYRYIKNEPHENIELKGYEIVESERKRIRLLLLGIWSLSMGLFTYLVVRGVPFIATSNFGGRDSMVVPMGAAIIFYVLIASIFKDKHRKIIFITMLLSGVCYFNFYYLAYQRDYYKNVGFQYQLTEHPELKELSTMICEDSTSEVLSMSRFYTWNIDARNVYGDQTRFILNGKNDLKYLDEQKNELNIFVERPAYGMMQYNCDDTSVKCVLVYKFTGSYLDTIRLMTDGREKEVFDSMGSYSQLDIYYPGTDEFNSVLGAEAAIGR